ncbi:MAG: thiamine pyrophosphate-binding protein [Spirochaetota bacterium]
MANGAKLVVEALLDKKVEYIFSLSGGHITPIYEHLENSPIKIFDTRHEQAAVFMAEAWGRLSRKPGVALVTAGPGFTNALTAIANARLSNAPVLLIAGCVGLESNDKLDLQDMKQLPVIEPMVKKAFVCHKPERVYEYVDMAYRTACSGRPGPVYLELPVDVLNAKQDETKVKKTNTLVYSKPCDSAAAFDVIELLQHKKKPIIIAGSGAWYADASEALKQFIEQTGIPVFTNAAGRGVIPDTHPLCFESSLAIRPGAALYANFNADMVILLGNRVSLYYIFGDIFNKDATLVQVDIEPEEIGRNRSIHKGIISDVSSFVGECNKILKEKQLNLTERFKEWVRELKKGDEESKKQAMEQWQSNAVPIHAMRVAYEVNQIMDKEDDVVVSDGGDAQIWMGMTRTVKKGGTYLDSGLYGCLGVGIPFANAAKLYYKNSRVVLFTGDGSLGFNFMEIETALRKGLAITIVVSNDLGWGMIRHSQVLRMGHPVKEGTFIGNIPYHKLVEALGGKGYFIEKPDDIKPAIVDAVQSNTVALVNIMTDPDTISPGSVALANLGGYKA